ncbi:HAD hydrolase family protein [Pseudomonas sp. CBSPCBW29]|nr:HAD hydrolase family protein [Pseudomonas sp. CBSPCBW29]
MRAAGAFFSLASGRPPRPCVSRSKHWASMCPLPACNGGTLVNPDGSILVAHHLPAEAALVALALFTPQPDVEVWLFADGDWLRRDPGGPMAVREEHGLGYGAIVVESFEPFLDRVDKIVAASTNTQLLIELEAQLQPRVEGSAQVSRSQPVFLDVTAMKANKGEALNPGCTPGCATGTDRRHRRWRQ